MAAVKYPVYKPCLCGNEERYVLDCLRSSWISSKGEYIDRFEAAFAAYMGDCHAATCSNGTVALHLALLALGIGPGDEVIVPTLAYIAAVNAIAYTGATPVFTEAEADFWQMSAVEIERRITPRTKAIMAVHLYGHPCRMDAIMDIARRHNLRVIEDCAEAFGAFHQSTRTGLSGDIATFSFFGNKTVTTGEGGMVITRDPALDKLVRRYKGQGLAEAGEYWHDLIGYNYRMTNPACAIGLAQLERADEILRMKRAVAGWYRQYLTGLPVTFQPEAPDAVNSYWMCSLLADSAPVRNALRQHLRAQGVETRPFFPLVHTMPMYAHHAPATAFPVAADLSSRGINLPSYPELSQTDVKTICDLVGDFYHAR